MTLQSIHSKAGAANTLVGHKYTIVNGPQCCPEAPVGKARCSPNKSMVKGRTRGPIVEGTDSKKDSVGRRGVGPFWGR